MKDHEKKVSLWAYEAQAFTLERINTRLLCIVALNTLATMILFFKGMKK